MTFPEEVPETLRPWLGPVTSDATPEQRAFEAKTALRVITPGATSSESLQVLSALDRRSSRWDTDEESLG